ncbi:hypothetical protein WDZ11_00240 (plasmid) [Roseomonas mucosa]|uniref:hypothetical protein n=1 Tax=Roseomonas mucosa TaxID=207340 RepID=UPI0030CE8F7F
MPKGISTWEQIAPHRIPDSRPHDRGTAWTGCETGYILEAGRVERVRIPADGLALDILGDTHEDLPRTMMLAGPEHEHWHGWSLQHVAEIAERMVPWTTWLCAPKFFGCEAIARDAAFAGYAWTRPGVVLLRTCYGARDTIRTALHEAWHVAEEHLSPAEIAIVQAACDAGPSYPEGSYHARPFEQRAQSFEDWAAAVWATGGTPPAAKPGTLLGIFARVYSGELGRDVARRRRASANRMPPALLRQAAADRAADRQPVMALLARGLRVALAG